jgi:phosphate starvation-inducible membrane PsiE
MDGLKNWMKESANILFDDSKNDLRALPKSVRLQILLVLSFIWTTVFSLYIFSYTSFAFGWAGLYVAHVGLIFAVYMTFKQFHRAEEKSASVFQTKNFDPFKIMAIFFVVVFMFVFSKGIEVLNSTNSYDIKYDGPDKTPAEKWLPFTKKEKLIVKDLIKNLQLGLLIIILISTIVAVFLEIYNMYQVKTVTLADLLLMFLYLEVLAMVRVFWEQQSISITLPLLIAITALSRFIILQGKEMDPSALVYESSAILLIAIAIVVMRLRHSKKFGLKPKD